MQYTIEGPLRSVCELAETPTGDIHAKFVTQAGNGEVTTQFDMKRAEAARFGKALVKLGSSKPKAAKARASKPGRAKAVTSTRPGRPASPT